MSDFPRNDVRFDKYIGACPRCGRVRLELCVDGPEETPRAVGVECEKCHIPEKGQYHWELSNENPLHPPAHDEDFGIESDR